MYLPWIRNLKKSLYSNAETLLNTSNLVKGGGGGEKRRGGRGLVSLILGYSYNYKRFLLLVKSVAKKKSYARKKFMFRVQCGTLEVRHKKSSDN